MAGCCEQGNEPSSSTKGREQPSECKFLKLKKKNEKQKSCPWSRVNERMNTDFLAPDIGVPSPQTTGSFLPPLLTSPLSVPSAFYHFVTEGKYLSRWRQ